MVSRKRFSAAAAGVDSPALRSSSPESKVRRLMMGRLVTPYDGIMTLDLTDEEKLALAAELKRTLQSILDKLEPRAAREPSPQPKHYEPPRLIRGRRRRG
jgi:hypothetical protein